MTNAVISGTGSYLPERVVTNKELESKLDTSDEWIFTRTGIRARHISSTSEPTSFMAGQAAKKALAASNLTANDIELIIVATCTPDHVFPSMACHVQKSIGITKTIPAFDISAACSGFVYALDIAHQYIKAKTAKHVLVIGSETMSRGVDWNDRSTCVLFGDGAGAVVLSADDSKTGILGSKLHSNYDEGGLLTYPANAEENYIPKIGMKGNEVFKIAVNMMGDIVDEVLQVCNLKQNDIQWLIPHQANIRIIQSIAKKLNLSMSQVVVTIETQGNTSAASIPLALDYAVRNNQINRGDHLLFESFGGGMTWGAMVVQY